MLDGGLPPVKMNTHLMEFEVFKKPFMYYQLAQIRKHNVKKIILCVPSMPEKLRGYAKEKFRDVDISFVEPGDGGGNDLLKIQSQLDDVFFVAYYDRFLPIDYYLLWRWFNMNPMQMLGATVVSNPMLGYKPNLQADLLAKRVKSFGPDGANLIDWGISILNKKCLEAIPKAESLPLPGLLDALARRGELGAFLTDKNFFDLSEAGLKGLKRYILYSRF